MTDKKQPIGKAGKKSAKKTKADLAAHGVKVEKSKSNKKFYLGGAGALLVGLVLVWGLQPTKASMNYGICKTYIELNVPYPHTLKFMDLIDRKLLVRMTYSYIDAYGQTIFFPITCKFDRDEQGRKYLDSVDVNRDKTHPLEDEERLAEFNKSFGIQLFQTYKPALIRPPKMPKNIINYKKK
jgi:hypothetical protein|tara:strand:+ start:23389 stop:23934 length:546 start_codon:yes stop_codon:yes gene_type:complete